MDTIQINHALRHWKPHFKGTYAINHIPLVYTLDPPYAFVINLDAFPSGGSHWVALFCDEKGQQFYFDTAGLPPPEQLNRILDGNVIYSSNRMQSDCSSVCGEYCILFLASHFEHLTFPQMSRSNWLNNDLRVYKSVHEFFDIFPRKRTFPVVDEACIIANS